jgi:hypothetical protein
MWRVNWLPAGWTGSFSSMSYLRHNRVFTGCRGLFPEGKVDRGAEVMRKALLPPTAYMAWCLGTRTTIPFTFKFKYSVGTSNWQNKNTNITRLHTMSIVRRWEGSVPQSTFCQGLCRVAPMDITQTHVTIASWRSACPGPEIEGKLQHT